MGTDKTNAPTPTELTDTLSDWAVGGGILTVALAPLALPILALTAVALLPLLVPVVAVGLVVALVALPVLAARAVVRRVSRALRRTGAAEQPPTPAHRGV